jgi:hypothetical protein
MGLPTVIFSAEIRAFVLERYTWQTQAAKLFDFCEASMTNPRFLLLLTSMFLIYTQGLWERIAGFSPTTMLILESQFGYTCYYQ